MIGVMVPRGAMSSGATGDPSIDMWFWPGAPVMNYQPDNITPGAGGTMAAADIGTPADAVQTSMSQTTTPADSITQFVSWLKTAYPNVYNAVKSSAPGLLNVGTQFFAAGGLAAWSTPETANTMQGWGGEFNAQVASLVNNGTVPASDGTAVMNFANNAASGIPPTTVLANTPAPAPGGLSQGAVGLILAALAAFMLIK